MYAVSQGALAVECRSDDAETIEMLQVLHDDHTVTSCVAERAFLKRLVRISLLNTVINGKLYRAVPFRKFGLSVKIGSNWKHNSVKISL